MACVRVGSAIVCFSPWGRLHVGNRFYWVDFHEYFGPTFFHDPNMTKMYEPEDENDPIWPAFEKWLKKFREQKAKQRREK